MKSMTELYPLDIMPRCIDFYPCTNEYSVPFIWRTIIFINGQFSNRYLYSGMYQVEFGYCTMIEHSYKVQND